MKLTRSKDYNSMNFCTVGVAIQNRSFTLDFILLLLNTFYVRIYLQKQKVHES